MIREFIRECLMFRTKDRIVIWKKSYTHES